MVVTNLLNSYCRDFDLFILQEPSWSFMGQDKGKAVMGPVNLQGWVPIIPITHITEDTRPRTMTYYRPRPDFSVTLRTDLIEDRDIQIIDIRQPGHPLTTIINVYNDTPSGRMCILNRIRELEFPFDHPTIITGDFNLHHDMWSRGHVGHDQMTEEIVEWLTEKGFTLLNPKGEITHPSRTHTLNGQRRTERPSVIDLSFVNGHARQRDTFQDWAIDPSLAHDSDHYAIKFTIDHGRKEIENPCGIKYNLKDVSPAEWLEAFHPRLEEARDILDNILSHPTPSTDQLDLFVNTLTTALQDTTNKVAKARRFSPNAKPWWDDDMKEAAERVADARREQRIIENILGESNPHIRAKIKQSRNFFKKLCKFKKREWATNVLQNAATNDIWTFRKWSTGSRNYPTPPIARGHGLPRATSHEEKCDALRNELYQPPPELEEVYTPNLETASPDDFTFEPVSEEEVREAIFNNSSNTAPGHSQISYKVLNFLSNREAAICLDGIRGEMHPVQNGIPQGSPVSPILAAFYTAELLEIFTPPNNSQPPATSPDSPTKINLLMYVDDGKLFVSSNSLETNTILLKNAYLEAEAWLRRAGLSPDFSKRELMHYSRRRKHNSNPSIMFNDSDGATRIVTPEATVRWLGVHFDRKLRFERHVKILAASGENTVSALTMLANTVRGLSQVHLRRLYTACVIPKILYACPAWWNGTRYQSKPLEKVQNRALRLICAAFRTTPITALEIEASIPPIRHQIHLHIKRCAIRFNKLDPNNALIRRLPNSWHDGQEPTPAPPLPPHPNKLTHPRSTTLQIIASHTSPAHERIQPFLIPPWRRTPSHYPGRLFINNCPVSSDKDTLKDQHIQLVEGLKSNINAIVVYSDGSLVKQSGFQRAGAATVGFHCGSEIFSSRMGLGGHAEIFDAEQAALMMSATKAVDFARNQGNITHLHFYSDNSSAISSIFDPKPRGGQLYSYTFCNKICDFLDNNPQAQIHISWCPSHCGILGNERADQLAKEATQLAHNSPIGVTRTNALRRAKLAVLKTWRREWQRSNKSGGYAPSNRIPPSLKPTPHFAKLKNQRELFGRLVQCRTNHTYSGEFRKRFNLGDPIQCPCGEIVESREHILCACPRYANSRHMLRKVSRDVFVPDILGTKEGITALVDFLKASGAFTRTGSCPTTLRPPAFDDEPLPNPDTDDSEDDGG
ncbi:hypothetical protein CVT26_001146 [Gymnopilus dilepis]|uniref:RNase H type-1 domain-containing protein n=1 Tax=Gymnopilus dilepis TaxID=231916 RepID=A0A409YLK7_9AGAR|nr:hypothetical protein CVT26_001146 [Gymnopilus dilepis]